MSGSSVSNSFWFTAYNLAATIAYKCDRLFERIDRNIKSLARRNSIIMCASQSKVYAFITIQPVLLVLISQFVYSCTSGPRRLSIKAFCLPQQEVNHKLRRSIGSVMSSSLARKRPWIPDIFECESPDCFGSQKLITHSFNVANFQQTYAQQDKKTLGSVRGNTDKKCLTAPALSRLAPFKVPD